MAVGRRDFSRIVTITKPLFHSEARRPTLVLLALLAAFILTVSGLNVVNNVVGGRFMSAVVERQSDRLPGLTLLYLGVFAALTAVTVVQRYCEERLGLVWRDWLTRYLIERYLTGRAYFWIAAREAIDNPDQRIAEDVKTFTTTTLSFGLIVLNSTITLFAFTGILWSITPWLVATALLYAAAGSLASILIGRRLVGLNFLQYKKEADFRYELIQVREHAESIAMLRDEGSQGGRLRRRLAALVENYRAIIGVNRNLGFFTTAFNYLTQIIPVLLVAPLYIRGEVEFGKVTQAAMAFGFVLGAFSLIVSQFQVISSYAAVIARLGSFWEAIDEAQAPAGPMIEVVRNDDRVVFDDLTLESKDGRPLVRNLKLEVPRGARLLITGPHAAGKSALFEATAGIWRWGNGRILRPPSDDVMFLPDRPYLVQGSLRHQLVDDSAKVPDERIRAVLRAVKFEPALERVGGLDVERDWRNSLSLGEQQLLAVARLLLKDPHFAFLDKPFTALEAELKLHLCRVLDATGITLLLIADEPAMREYFDVLLTLDGDGGWQSRACRGSECYSAQGEKPVGVSASSPSP